MTRTIIILIFTLTFFSLTVQGKDSVKIFAKAISEDNGKVFVDDSTIVSVYVYSNHPFGEVKIDDKQFKMKSCRVRRIHTSRQRHQSVTGIGGVPYYTIICAQYSVAGLKPGSTIFPQININATLLEEEQQKESNGDSFFDMFGSIFRQPSYKKIKKSTRSNLLKMEIVKTPKKSAEQLMREGKVII